MSLALDCKIIKVPHLLLHKYFMCCSKFCRFLIVTITCFMEEKHLKMRQLMNTIKSSRISSVLIIIICLNIFLWMLKTRPIVMETKSIRCKENSSFFYATGEQLLDLHQIPKLATLRKRVFDFKPFKYQVSKNERIYMYHLLSVFDRLMKENGILYFIHSGTLLGSYRNHDLIPWDDDIDIFMSISERRALEEVFESSPINNLTLFYTPSHDKIYFLNESSSSHSYGWKWPYLDISFYEMNSTHIFDIVKTYGFPDTFPKSIIFPLTTRRFFTFDLPSPKDTFAYCVWSYGYTDDCFMPYYSHIIESFTRQTKKVKCKIFAEKYPYIKRYKSNEGIIEELIYKNKIIQRLVSNEPEYAVSESFSLTLQNGFSYPDDVQLPKKNHTGKF